MVGNGSETTVTKVLWDLSDGADLVDADHDGVALGPAAVLNAMIAHVERGEGAEFVSLGAFLQHLVRASVVEAAPLRAMLQATGVPQDILTVQWPRSLALGARASDKIDGLTQPAPGGGRNLPVTGFSANHTYLVRVESAGLLVARLRIDGSGLPSDRADLDLEILDRRAERLGSSRGERPVESVGRFVEPGVYLVRVRDGGSGNRADYSLSVDLEAPGGSGASVNP